jgi:ABC-type sugar transport system ATPase subunit
MRHVTLRQLRALLAIQAQGKIINTAKALGLTSPATTLQLKQMEEDAGVVLFDHTTQRMWPTQRRRRRADHRPRLRQPQRPTPADPPRASTTMVVVTHEMGFAGLVSDQVVFMDEGKVVEAGARHQFFLRPESARLQRFLAEVV